MRGSICTGMKQATNARTALGAFSMAMLVFLSSMDTILKLFPVTSLQPNDYHTNFVISAIYSDIRFRAGTIKYRLYWHYGGWKLQNDKSGAVYHCAKRQLRQRERSAVRRYYRNSDADL